MSETTASERNPNDIEWPFTYTFKSDKEVKAHGERIWSLTLREPTGDDVLKFDLLDRLSQEQFAPLVATLAQVPESTVRAMSAKDVMALASRLSRFFVWAGLEQ